MAKKRRAAKKAVKEDYSKYLLAIVAIVAVVGVVLMVNNGGTTSVSEGELVVSDGGDLAGEARRAVSLKPNLLKAKKLYVNFLPLMNAYKPDLVPLGAFFVAESTEKCAIKVYVKNQGLAS
ncbi:hypothetical protein HOC35_06725, partial [Candidatus Woesearchaeota archaeon]|nr:hypothetical protein [Candidatus Woesearchaeota archaeon]